MDKALYVAMTGASASLRAQGAVSQNLANIETSGFKAQLTSTESFIVPGAGLASRIDAVPSSLSFDNSAGNLRQTGRPLDVAFAENRWLAVQARDGGEAYTRNGELRANALGQLTTHSGHLVLGEGGPITIPPYQQIAIGADGTISIVPQGQGPETVAIVGRLRVVPGDQLSLQRGLDGLMRATGAPPEQAAGQVLTSGAFEGSNVNAAGMLVQMIELQRQFEMQIKIIQSGDENARTSNELLRLT